MRLRNLSDVEAFKGAVNRCVGDVWIESTNGDKFDLKSMFSQYLAIAKLIEDHDEELELFVRNKEDEQILLGFFNTHEQTV